MIMDKHPSVKQTRVIDLQKNKQGSHSIVAIESVSKHSIIHRGLFVPRDRGVAAHGQVQAGSIMHPIMRVCKLTMFMQNLTDQGLFTMMRGHSIFCNPPLIITEAQVYSRFS